MLAGLTGLIFAASFYVTMQWVFTGREVDVPELAGVTLEEARLLAGRSELYLEEDEPRYDQSVPAGLVRSQDPPAGATIKKNRKVRVSLSLGPLAVSIPDVRGQSIRTAQLALERLGLRVGHVSHTSDDRVPEDVVMSQDPLPSEGSQAELSGRSDGGVDLLVSRGSRPARLVMPDLTGRRLAEVNDFARRARLRVGPVRREAAPGTERGTVVRQYPPAGRPVGRQEIISLVLSDSR